MNKKMYLPVFFCTVALSIGAFAFGYADTSTDERSTVTDTRHSNASQSGAGAHRLQDVLA